jgi:hypothetical protein
MLLALLFQGGALRPCQWEDLLGGDGESGCASTRVVSADAGLSAACHDGSGESLPCFCEYRKTEAQSQRLAAGDLKPVAPLTLASRLIEIAPCAFSRVALPVTVPPAPPDLGRCLPLLI